MLQYKSNKKELVEYTEKNRDYFSHVDYESAQAIKTLLGTGVLLRDKLDFKGKEGNDVCKALQDLYDDGVAEGMERGREEGRALGLIRGRILTHYEYGLTPEEIAVKLNKSLEYVNEVLGLQMT